MTRDALQELAVVSSNRGPYFAHHSRFVSLFLFLSIVLTTHHVVDEPRQKRLDVEEHLEEFASPDS